VGERYVDDARQMASEDDSFGARSGAGKVNEREEIKKA